MSKETSHWLNRNTLIGYTDKRGHAWHYRRDDQGAEPNHYPGPIPVGDVRRRLFDWEPVTAPVRATATTPSGDVIDVTDKSRKVIIRPDTQTVLGVFRASYQPHSYDQWLVSNVETLLDADLAVGSAGLLRGGAVAWVQVEMADTIETHGVEFRPFLTAATSLDGSLATTYQVGAQVVVCDNTLSVALNARDAARVRIRHSSKSLGRLAEVRDGLGIVHEVGDAFAAEVEELCRESVTDDRFARWTEAYTAPATGSDRADKRAREQAGRLIQLWRHDTRVAPWQGTAYGVLAAANTFEHHFAETRGRSKAERNTENTVMGRWSAIDERARQLLATV